MSAAAGNPCRFKHLIDDEWLTCHASRAALGPSSLPARYPGRERACDAGRMAVQGVSRRIDVHESVSRCTDAKIALDTDLVASRHPFNAAELLAALSACMIEGIERVAPILKFSVCSVEEHSRRPAGHSARDGIPRRMRGCGTCSASASSLPFGSLPLVKHAARGGIGLRRPATTGSAGARRSRIGEVDDGNGFGRSGSNVHGGAFLQGRGVGSAASHDPRERWLGSGHGKRAK